MVTVCIVHHVFMVIKTLFNHNFMVTNLLELDQLDAGVIMRPPWCFDESNEELSRYLIKITLNIM